MRTVSLCEEREEDIAAILKQPDSSLLLLSNVHFASMDWLAQLPNKLRDTTAKGIACFCLFVCLIDCACLFLLCLSVFLNKCVPCLCLHLCSQIAKWS